MRSPGSWKEVCKEQDTPPPKKRWNKNTAIEQMAGRQGLRRIRVIFSTEEIHNSVWDRILEWDQQLLEHWGTYYG